MKFQIKAINEEGQTTIVASTPREAMDAYLKFYREDYKPVLIEDNHGRTLNLNELSCLCEAAED
jgi:hypothetical protein